MPEPKTDAAPAPAWDKGPHYQQMSPAPQWWASVPLDRYGKFLDECGAVQTWEVPAGVREQQVNCVRMALMPDGLWRYSHYSDRSAYILDVPIAAKDGLAAYMRHQLGIHEGRVERLHKELSEEVNRVRELRAGLAVAEGVPKGVPKGVPGGAPGARR